MSYSLSIFWRDGDCTCENFESVEAARVRAKELDAMSFDEKPSWELADEDGNVVEESP